MKNFKQILNKYKKKSLSGRDIFDMLDGNIKIFTYPEITKYNNIHDILSPYGCCIILYLKTPTYGHWCALLQHKDRIEFFDPIKNMIPDDELPYINNDFRIASNQVKPHLLKLLYNSGSKIEYNNYNFQEMNNYDVRTCGRHCVSRIIFKNLLLDDYYDLIYYLCNQFNLSFDEIITLITI